MGLMKNIGRELAKSVSYHLNLGSSKPETVIINITNRCNMMCRQCNAWKSERVEELSVEQWKMVLEELEDWLGTFNVTFSGGEPLLYEGLLDIIKYCTEKGIKVNLLSNGSLITEEMTVKLKEAGVDTVCISLDSLDFKKHDHIRNSYGLFVKVATAISSLKKNGIKIGIATIMMGDNADELPKIAEFAERNLLEYIIFQPLFDNFFSHAYNPAWYKESELWPDEEELKVLNRSIETLINHKKAGKRIANSVQQLEKIRMYFNYPEEIFGECLIGCSRFSIMPDAEMHICDSMDSIGNIKKISMINAWKSSKAKEIRDRIKSCNKSCFMMNCNYEDSMTDKIKNKIG